MRSRVREALFNHLGPRLRGARFLDIFSGSGAIGIEALSRGAAHVVLVEHDREVLRVLERNVTNLDLGQRCQVQAVDIYQGARQLGLEPFDVIFLDPPFGDFRSEDRRDPAALLATLVEGDLLKPGAVIGYERPSKLDPIADPVGTEVEFRRAYGDTTLELWEKRDTRDSENR